MGALRSYKTIYLYWIQWLEEGASDSWRGAKGVTGHTDVRVVRRKSGSADECGWEIVKQMVHWGRATEDMQVTRPDLRHGRLPGWPDRSYAMRVAAWYFLNIKGVAGRHSRRGLSWAQFQSMNQKGTSGYWWQADHTRPGQTANCFVGELELKTQRKHALSTQQAQLEFMHSVPKPFKRPAAAMH